MTTVNPVNKRKHIRFDPDKNTMIWISKNTHQFHKDFLGLVDGESHGGTAFTINQDLEIMEGDFILVQVGQLNTMKAQVRWIKEYDENLYRIGIMYLE